jgi:hypothetical protein
MKKFFVAASMLALSAAAVSAASLTDVSGAVKINKGDGFVDAVVGAELNAGDKVFVGKGGFASVNFGACAVTLDKATVYAVSETAPCDGNGTIKPTADVADTVYPPVFPIWPVVAIGAAVGGFIIYEVLNDDGVSENGAPPPV